MLCYVASHQHRSFNSYKQSTRIGPPQCKKSEHIQYLQVAAVGNWN